MELSSRSDKDLTYPSDSASSKADSCTEGGTPRFRNAKLESQQSGAEGLSNCGRLTAAAADGENGLAR